MPALSGLPEYVRDMFGDGPGLYANQFPQWQQRGSAGDRATPARRDHDANSGHGQTTRVPISIGPSTLPVPIAADDPDDDIDRSTPPVAGSVRLS
jgi:hypothetical protein